MMLCIFDTTEQCPRTANQMEQMVNDMVEKERRRFQTGSYFPTYADVKSYIKDTCPSVPTGNLIKRFVNTMSKLFLFSCGW